MIVLIAGTRPEVVKLAPVYREMRKQGLDARWVFTGQQAHIGLEAFEPFGISPEYRYELDRVHGDLVELNALLANTMQDMIRDVCPDMVVVQGDTLSAAVGAQVAFLNRTPVAHVEAGLRSWDVHSPFPEEASRIWIDAIADLKFAPTQRAALTLSGDNVWVTGNTEIDAMRLVEREDLYSGNYAVVTMHRRENLENVSSVCAAVLELVRKKVFDKVVWPVHPNPEVRKQVEMLLGKVKEVDLTDPLPFNKMVNTVRNAKMLLTDSGGLQEEALGLGVPCLVLRQETERPEGVEVGGARLVGTEYSKVVGWATWIMQTPEEWNRMSKAPNPYGDGRAAERITLVCKAHLEGRRLQPEVGNWSGVTV